MAVLASTTGMLVGGVGVGLGALASGIGYLLKQYGTDRRVARRVLFNLLEIREVCAILAERPEDLSNHYLEEYKSAAREVFGSEEVDKVDWSQNDIINAFKGLAVKAILSARPSIDESMHKRFVANVEALSEWHPVLAYKLIGRGRLQTVFGALDAYEATSKSALFDVAPKNMHSLLDFSRDIARSSATEGLGKDLDEDIRRVAWAAGVANYCRCVWLMYRAKDRDVRARLDLRKNILKLLREMQNKARVNGQI